MFKEDSNIKQTIKSLTKQIKQYPLLFARLGECFIEINQTDKAENILIGGIEHHPEYATGYLVLGESYLFAGQIRSAEEVALDGLRHHPDNLGLMHLLEKIKRRMEDFLSVDKIQHCIRNRDPLLDESLAKRDREDPETVLTWSKVLTEMMVSADEHDEQPLVERIKVPKPMTEHELNDFEEDLDFSPVEKETAAGSDTSPEVEEPVDLDTPPELETPLEEEPQQFPTDEEIMAKDIKQESGNTDEIEEPPVESEALEERADTREIPDLESRLLGAKTEEELTREAEALADDIIRRVDEEANTRKEKQPEFDDLETSAEEDEDPFGLDESEPQAEAPESVKPPVEEEKPATAEPLQEVDFQEEMRSSIEPVDESDTADTTIADSALEAADMPDIEEEMPTEESLDSSSDNVEFTDDKQAEPEASLEEVKPAEEIEEEAAIEEPQEEAPPEEEIKLSPKEYTFQPTLEAASEEESEPVKDEEAILSDTEELLAQLRSTDGYVDDEEEVEKPEADDEDIAEDETLGEAEVEKLDPSSKAPADLKSAKSKDMEEPPEEKPASTVDEKKDTPQERTEESKEEVSETEEVVLSDTDELLGKLRDLEGYEEEEIAEAEATDEEINAETAKTEPKKIDDKPEETISKSDDEAKLKPPIKFQGDIDAFGLPMNVDDKELMHDLGLDSEAAQKDRKDPEPKADTEEKLASPPPKNRIATRTLGELYATQHKYDEAIDVYQQLIEKDPENQSYKERLDELKKQKELSSI